MKKHMWKIIIGAAIVLMAGSFFLSQQASKGSNDGIVVSDHIKTAADPKATLTEYGDFQCPACGQFYPIVSAVLEQYGGNLSFEFKNFPLPMHPYAIPAAKAAEAAGQQGKYFEMYDKLYQNQDAWAQSSAPQAFFNQYAEELGLNMDQFKKQMRSSILSDHIKAQQKEAMDKGFTGTPSFELNGEKLEFTTYEEFIGKIEAALGIENTAASSSASTTAEDGAGVEFGLPGA
jgi:protein-disulfide isomerase